ncbi:MAG: DUF1566 domain-containing protein [Paludibacter sp.]
MKKSTLVLFVIILSTSLLLSQVPQKISYQAVVRNASNNPITNTTVGMKISILLGSVSGTPIYVETQTPTSNQNGLISLEIGSGTPVAGSFSVINWQTGVFFIKTETDLLGGSNYTIAGTTQLLSVPYSIYSKTSGSLPCYTQAERDLLVPSDGIVVFNKTSKKPNYYDGTIWRNYDNTVTTINLSTTSLSSLSSFSADCGGTIISDGGSPIIARGVCWSINPNPTIALSTKTSESGNLVTFPSVITGLIGNTKYYVRSYATNSAGTDYGNEISFTTLVNSAIGDSFKGGNIGYFLKVGDLGYNANVKHGLIVKCTSNIPTLPWAGCDNSTLIGASGTSLGSGIANTQVIFNKCIDTGSGGAGTYCYNLSLESYDDWYLPSIDELKKIQLSISVLSNLMINYNNGDYPCWSSSEKDANNAWYITMSNGQQNSYSKGATFNVWAVRSF